MKALNRVFERVFTEVSISGSCLQRVKSASWWDGKILLTEHLTQSRDETEHEWSESDLVVTVIEPALTRSLATRRAIAIHDDLVRRTWGGEE